MAVLPLKSGTTVTENNKLLKVKKTTKVTCLTLIKVIKNLLDFDDNPVT